ncbi:reverse transcriptase domain-containing protein [Tanacetum coccineum]
MAKDDEEKTAFHTSQGVYCYTKMPFGLKNAGATYQRLVDNAFEGQVGRNLEVYVDDLVIKSHTEDEGHVPRILDRTGRHQAVSRKNKSCHPTSFTAHDERSPIVKWEVSRFEQVPIQVSRQVTEVKNKSLPLSKHSRSVRRRGGLPLDYRKQKKLSSSSSSKAALPTLVAPRPGEELIMYLSATHGAISAVLLTDRNSVQTPVYFVSKALKETEINYSAMEKLILALVFAAKRLRRYFQAHPVAVITDQPIKQVTSKNPDAPGRFRKMSVLLGSKHLYRPQHRSGKGHKIGEFSHSKTKTDTANEQDEGRNTKPLLAGLPLQLRMGRSDFEMVSSYRRSYPTTMFGRMKGMGRVEGWHRCVGNPIHRHTMCSTRDALAGSCSMHSGPRSVVAKALRSGYNWPNMHRDARDMIQNCKDSQGTPPLFIDSMSRDESSHIPAEIGMPTIRTAKVNITTNDDERRIDLDILEERREQAAIREEKAKLKMV